MEWWHVVVVAGLMAIAVCAVAPLAAGRASLAKAKGLAGRLARLPWRLKLKFAARLVGDKRISVPVRLLPPLLGLYIAMPIDIVPDFIPALGQLDDLVIVLAALALLVRFVPTEIIDSHIAALEAEAVVGP